MSFGFGSGQQQQSTFGGFGSGSTGGFGQSTTTSGGSLFGGGQTATSGGFGGFGSTQQTSSPFGQQAKPAFGAPAATSGGSSLFGGGTATSGGFGSGGGFGSSTTGTGGFGSSTGGGLFGQQQQPKPTGFGSTSTGGSLFGGGGTTGGFGSSQPQQPSNPFSTQPQGGTGSGFTFGGASTASNNNGTANTPFQAFSEKDTAGGQTSSYQSISFQQPYQTKSFEELRTEDYAQGRRFGNSNGQAGSFGQSTGFGGFGQTSTSGGGLFGGSTTQTSGGPGFGSTGGFGSTSTGGFGSTQQTGGGLFGTQQPKPATGGLFGTQTSATSTGGFGSTSGSGGGLFGGGSTGGFGSGTQSGTTGGGLFGTQNQQQQPKPAFGGFGQTQSTGTGFGSGTSTGGGLFGSTQNQGTGSSLFGQQPQQQQSNPFGGTSSTGGGLFGQQNKPAGGGLFGGSTGTSSTGTGLFGAQNQQQQSNPFGGSTTTGGGLFGNQNQPKPTGTGLFGSSTSGTTGGGLFGGQQNQQTGTSLFGGGQQGTGSSLFGNQNRPAGGSLFGGTQNTSGTGTGLSLFGGNNQNQQNSTGTSLFGGSLGQNNQNQQNQSMNSIFGGSFNQSTPQGNSQNQLHASLTDAPFGNGQLFSSLASPSPPIGPLATPLSGARPAPRKTPSLLASARLNTPVYSPRGSSLGRNGSFGFSYSTYGTPGSAYTSGSLTPGASSLLRPTGSLSSALTSRLNKSLSTSNLRGDATASEGRSLLRPSAFSPDGNAGRYSNGSIRKLNIDRSLRTDLFGMQPKAIETAKDNDAPSLRKRVSFENTGRESTAKPTAENALVRTEEPEEELPSPGLVRAGPSKSKAPEMEQVNGPLSSVPEDAEAPRASSAPGAKAPAEKASKRGEVGDYWTKPAMKDLKNMARAQLKSVGNFIVGREGVGRIEFGPVDLTNTALEDICGNIVQLNPRSATVYQDDQDKPRMGLALNVPSTIYLDNSWPRSHGGKKPINVKSGKDYDKHIARLKRVAGTHFLNYDADTGVWSFKVDHFTTYGLDDDDDESEFADDSRMQEPSSPLSELPETPKGQEDVTLQSMETGSGEPDDTFQFKLDRLPRPTPGGFDDLTHEEPSGIDEVHENEPMMSGGMGDLEDPFLSSGGAVQPPLPGTVERYNSSLMEEDEEPEQDIPGSFVPEPTIPKSILKPSTFLNEFVSPEKLATEAWEDQLQRTMSPKKRDRQALKEMQQVLLRMRDDDVVESPFKKSMLGHSALDQSYLAQRSVKKAKINDKKAELGKSQAFNNAMDIMGSLWTQETKGRKATAGGKDFEYPHSKRPRLSNSNEMSSEDRAWHDSWKPSFSNSGVLVYAASGSTKQVSGELAPTMKPVVGERRDVRFAKFVPATDLNAMTLLAQKEATTIDTSSGFPLATAPSKLLFASLADNVDPQTKIATHETSIWKLCSILFDPLNVSASRFMQGVPEDKHDEFAERMRMDALSAYWADLTISFVQDGLKHARTAEEKALLYLTQNDVVAACEVLISARDFKLATLVSQLPGTDTSRTMMQGQIAEWRYRNDWSEMSDPVRALFSIIAGETWMVEGKGGAAENRAAGFSIAERFGLSWQQSFALQLFFGGHETIATAIQAYSADLNTDRDSAQPSKTWPNGNETRDIRVDVMRFYAGDTKDVMVLIDPLAVSGSSVSSRLTWQLATIFNARGICNVPQAQLDEITHDFAAEMETAGRLVNSAWILLHLTDRATREKAITGLLEREGERLSTPGQHDMHGTFEELVEDTHIPASLLWRAKAMYAKAGGDPALQADWLLRAGEVDEAHEVLCSTLGPQAVIERDYDVLGHVLQLFPRRLPEGWQQGGQVYSEFMRLVRAHAGQQVNTRRIEKGLALMEEHNQGKSREERVAILEMSRVLEQTMRENDEREGDKLAGMAFADANPLGADLLNRYQQVMST